MLNRLTILKSFLWASVGVLAAVSAVRFSQGLGAVTNLSDASPWGLWIGFDVMAGVALAAGGFVMAATVYIFGLEKYRSCVRPAILTALLVLVSMLLPQHLLPVSFMLRIVAFFQGCAQVFFVTWPYEFPYRGGGYIHGTVIACLMLISLVPILLGFTYFLFDFKLYRKIGLALLTMCHLVAMVPLQYTLHAYLLSHFSLLFLPLLFFVFGLPLNTLIVIAFYSWGFSWKDHLRADDRPQAAPVVETANEGAAS